MNSIQKKNHDSDDIKRIIMIFLVFAFFIYSFYSANKKNKEVRKYGIYSIAYAKSRGSNWMTSEFKFRGRVYSVKSAAENGPRVAIVRFLPYNPHKNFLLSEIDVPKCLSRDSIPDEGWKELPVINCPE